MVTMRTPIEPLPNQRPSAVITELPIGFLLLLVDLLIAELLCLLVLDAALGCRRRTEGGGGQSRGLFPCVLLLVCVAVAQLSAQRSRSQAAAQQLRDATRVAAFVPVGFARAAHLPSAR